MPQDRWHNRSHVRFGHSPRFTSRPRPAGRGVPHGTTHFILLPDGSLKFDPSDRVTGTTLQQLEALRKHSDYLALVYARCA